MLTIVICVGSSCHVRGCDEVAATFERLIQEERLEARVELIGAFCMEHCSKGVSVRVGNQVFAGVLPSGAEAFFREEILPMAETADERSVAHAGNQRRDDQTG